MPFHFRQFSISQDRCAMKIGTDGILLGAWADFGQAESILDIGTGTGLLALMAAQKCPTARVDAIELAPKAAVQAAENMAASPWPARLQVLSGDVKSFSFPTPYDHLICNPPFFHKSLKSTHPERSLARHDDTLSIQELLAKASQLLVKEGRLSIILPASEEERVGKVAHAYDLCVQRFFIVKSFAYKAPHRILVELRKAPTGEIERGEISLHQGRKGDYTQEYRELTQEFYLWLGKK